MNHLESAITGKNNFWRYIVMVAAVFLVSNTIGAFPLLIAMFIKAASSPEIITQFAANPGNYSLLGVHSNILLILMIFPFIAGLVAFILLIKPLNNRSLYNTINGTMSFRWSRFFIGALVWLILSSIYLFVYLKADPSNFSVNNKTSSLIVLSFISVLIIPFQASFEEILFRGYLMQGFSVIFKNRWFPLLMTSVLFGLMHALNPEVKEFGFLTMMPQYILFGLIFGMITILDDGIEASMGAHAANNIFLCIMVTQKSSALQTPALYEQHNIYPWTEFTGLLLAGSAFVLILKLIFKWDDFSVIFSRVKVEKATIQIP